VLCAPANEHVFFITSLAPPGVVIQLDDHGAERLLMTHVCHREGGLPTAAIHEKQ
jgi:hypothetical protein